MKVYFDKNVLSHIICAQRGDKEAHGVTLEDVSELIDAVSEGKLISLLSTMHLQEAAYVIRAASREKAKEELKLIQDLMDTTQIIKLCGDLLTDDVIAYPNGDGPVSPLIPFNYDLWELFRPDGDVGERKEALDKTDEQNEALLQVLAEGKENDRDVILEEFGGSKPGFEEFFCKKIDERILQTIRKVEERTNSRGLVDACKERGITEMGSIPSILLAEGSSLSYQYARIFGEISEKKKKRWGDPSDLKHALSASACDIFVTHDEDFAFWIGRIPNIRIEVLDHLHSLVERL